MSRYLAFLLIILVLVTGCMTPVQTDTPAVVQTTGSVEVSSTPPGAEVYLDNVYKGTTPVTIIDQPGSHLLELRLRDYQSWSKSIQIVTGTKIYVDTTLALVPVLTSLPTSVQTTGPTIVPTTRPRTTPVGCWKYENTTGDTTFFYIFDLESGGTGEMGGTKTSPGISETLQPMELVWSYDPASFLVTVREANPPDPADPDQWVFTYDADADVLTIQKSKSLPMLFRRISCFP